MGLGTARRTDGRDALMFGPKKLPSPKIVWELLDSNLRTYRTPVPGGRCVKVDISTRTGATFFPDPEHRWDGGTFCFPCRRPRATLARLASGHFR